MAEIFFHPTMVEKFPWAVFPLVSARSPEKRSAVIKLMVSKMFIAGNLRKNLRTPIFQAWAHIVGSLPPSIPNIDHLYSGGLMPTFTTLENAHACFRGVERPHDSELDGASVFIYCIKVPLTLRWDNTPPIPLPVVHRLTEDVVLTVLVAANANLQHGTEQVWGRVLKIELVETAPGGDWLPIEHESRYHDRRW